MAIIHQLGPFRLDGQAGILFRAAEPLGLGQRAVALLRVLVERAGAPVSKDELIEAGWAGLAVEEGNLTVQIAAVRRMLGQEPGGENWIETLPRRGYRYIGPVGAAEGESSVAIPMTKRHLRRLGDHQLQSCPFRASVAVPSRNISPMV
jgi:adenylate cyclase